MKINESKLLNTIFLKVLINKNTSPLPTTILILNAHELRPRINPGLHKNKAQLAVIRHTDIQ